MRAAWIGVALALAASAAQAGPVEEVRTAVLYHDVLHPGSEAEDGADIEIDVLFREWGALKILGRPKINLTGSLNTAGDTNFASIGLVWDKDFSERWYGEFTLGYAVHDGEIAPPPGVPPSVAKEEHLYLGSRDLIRSSVSLGYRLDDRWSVALEWVHLSHGEVLAHGDDYNTGIDAVGVRFGRRMD